MTKGVPRTEREKKNISLATQKAMWRIDVRERFEKGLKKRIQNCELISQKTKEAMQRPEVRQAFLKGLKNRDNIALGRKSSKTKKEKFELGLSKPWNKGYGEYVEGNKNPNWRGGIGLEPYSWNFNQKFKDFIKRRDNYTCQLCSLFEADSLNLYKRGLAIHHINYDKKLTIKENTISLCIRCNILVNKDREIWQRHFCDLLRKLYGYEYTEKQKVILDFIEARG